MIRVSLRLRNLGLQDKVALVSQVDSGDQFKRFLRNTTEAELRGDHHDMDLHLGTRQELSNALVRTRAKRQRGQGMALADLVRRKAIRLKRIRVFP
jgi:hypothetical protein